MKSSYAIYEYARSSKMLLQLREFRGHSARVLHMAKSPDGTTVVTASADETLRFWQLFSDSSSRRSSIGAPSSRRSSAASAVSCPVMLGEDTALSGPGAGGSGAYMGMSIR
jgi:hypothetical protein